MRFAAGWLCALTAIVITSSALSQDAKESVANVETVVSGLTRPGGIALQPETGVVFVADSGAGRVCRVVDGKLETVIDGSPTEASATGADAIGPLGLAFVDKQTLAVGDGGYAAGEDRVRIYKLSDDAKKVLEHKAGAESELAPGATKGDEPAPGDFVGLALARHGLYVIAGAGGGDGWVLKSSLKGTKFGELERTIKTSTDALGSAPKCITLSSRGEIVLGLLSGEASSAKCYLAFYSAKTSELLLSLETGLNSVSAIAYSPKTGLLYALGTVAGEGGLYRLDSDTTSGGQKINATRIAKLDGPAALAFDKDGTAYMAVHGADGEASGKPAGAVVKIGGL